MKILRYILKSAVFLALALIIGAGLVIFQMSTGFIRVGFLTERVGEAIGSRLPANSSVTAGGVKLSFAAGWSVLATIDDLDISVPQRGRVQAKALGLTLPTGSLLLGNVEPRAVSADGVAIEIAELPAGDLSGSRAEFFRNWLHQFATRFREGNATLAAREIDSITIANVRIGGAAITKTGLFRDRPVLISQVTWSPASDDQSLIATIESDQGNWQLALTSGRDEAGLEFSELVATELPPAYFLPRLADPAKRPYYDAKLKLVSRILTDKNGAFASARALFSFGPGYLSLRRDDASIIDRVDIALELAAGSESVALARGDVRIGGTHVAYRGNFGLSAFGRPVTYAFELGPSRLVSQGSALDPILVDAGKANGLINLEKSIILLEDAVITGEEGQIRAAGDFRWSGIAPGLSGALTIEETTTRMARALWLPIIAARTRNWFDQNVKSGLLGPGTVQIALPMENLGPSARGRPLPPDGVVGTVPFQFAQFTPLRDLPLVRNAFGTLNFADAAVTVGIERGDVSAGGFGVAAVGSTRFQVPNLGKPNPVGYLNLKLSGAAAAVAELSNAGRLNIAEERGITPASLSGEADVDLTANFSLTKPANTDDIDAEFTLALADFASSEPLQGQFVTDAQLLLEGTVRAYTVTGDANIDGIPADIDLSLGRGDASSSVKLRMDAEARQKVGIELESFISGDVIASVDPNTDQEMQEIFVDLTPAQIQLPFAGWQKGPGVSANLSMTIDRTGKRTVFRDVVVEGDGFKATAEVEVDENGHLVKLDAKDISLRPGDKFDVLLTGDGNSYKITVTGTSFDARGLIDQLLSSDDTGTFADDKYDIDMEIQQVRGFNNVSIGGLKGSIAANDGRIRKLFLQAATGTEQPLQMVAEENGGQRLIELKSGNGGATLRFLNLYTKAFGGDLRFRFAETGKTGEGSLLFDNFRVQNEQVLSEAAKERARSVAAEGEIRSTDVTIDPTNLSFARLQIPFSKVDAIVTVDDASLRGPSVGATSKGTIDLDGQNLSLSGTIVPAYGVNNIPGAIPIFGQILGGGKKEGLIGITYRMFGPIGSPTLKLNPASAIAPGIFRRLFEFN